MKDLREQIIQAGIKESKFDNDPQTARLYFEYGANWMRKKMIEELQPTIGAMILEGYDSDDNCITYIKNIIEELKQF